MKIKIVIAFVCALTAGSALGQGLSGVISQPVYEAQALEKAGDWKELEKMAQGWSATSGADWQSWYYYGLAQLKLGKSEQAVKTLSLALRLSPQENDRLLLLIADSYAANAKWRDAEISNRQLLKRYPNNANIWDKLRSVMEAYLATSPLNVEETRAALIDILKQLLAFGGYAKNVELWLRYAALLIEEKRDAEARGAYKYLLRLMPDNLEVLEWTFKYDVLHADSETLAKTIAHMQRLSPKNPLLHLYLAERALASGNKREARHHYEIISNIGQYPYQQAQALAGLGDLAGSSRMGTALSYYQRAIQADPSYLRAWERIVVILRSYNQHVLAQKYFARMRQVEKFVKAGQMVPRQLLQNIEG